MNAIAPFTGGTALVPQNMDQAVRLAQAMSSAKMVPKHLQGDIGTCLMVVEQAMRWRMSPFAVAQCTSNIGGKLNFEGKLVAAAVECSGVIEGGFDYQFKGAGDDRTITVSALRRGESAPRSMDVRLGDVKTGNEWWKKQPDQQLVYSGTRNWARRWAPSVMLGVYSPEEFEPAGSRPVTPFEGTTIEARAEPMTRDSINASVPLGDAATEFAHTPDTKYSDLFNEGDSAKWLANLKRHFEAAQTDADVTELGELTCVATALSQAPARVKQDIIAMMAAATARVAQTADATA